MKENKLAKESTLCPKAGIQISLGKVWLPPTGRWRNSLGWPEPELWVPSGWAKVWRQGNVGWDWHWKPPTGMLVDQAIYSLGITAGTSKQEILPTPVCRRLKAKKPTTRVPVRLTENLPAAKLLKLNGSEHHWMSPICATDCHSRIKMF